MKIELLYFDGCPSWQGGLENLKAALQAERLEVPVELVKVQDDTDAEQKKFLGSPSFRVNGVDLWNEERDQYSLSCRVYGTPQGLKGSPTVEMLRNALLFSSHKLGVPIHEH
ncbi:MAG TPA: hypothetical protein VGK00_13340 [Anaerolineales bacterium]|jgi:hypothetical protein